MRNTPSAHLMDQWTDLKMGGQTGEWTEPWVKWKVRAKHLLGQGEVGWCRRDKLSETMLGKMVLWHSARLGLIWVARNLIKGNKPFCMEERKIKKLRISDAGKINLKKTDFFENAKFISGLPNSYFLFEKKGFFACHYAKLHFLHSRVKSCMFTNL